MNILCKAACTTAGPNNAYPSPVLPKEEEEDMFADTPAPVAVVEVEEEVEDVLDFGPPTVDEAAHWVEDEGHDEAPGMLDFGPPPQPGARRLRSVSARRAPNAPG